MTAPKGLRAGGKALWQAVTGAHADLSGTQLATLEAACRQRDRADQLADNAAEGDVSALRHEREALLAMARLLTSLRLPDATGKRPQLRGIRGVHTPTGTAKDRMSSIDRARRRSVEDRLRGETA